MFRQFEPKLFTVFREGYTRHQFTRDLTAGVVVGIVALPLAIAFAIASGAKPEQGLYTAVVAGFVIALLGGCRVQVSGPTGAFIVVIFGIVHQYGYSGLAVATLIAGILLILMGFLGLGALLKFVPYPLTVGFTSGIAVIIFSSQIKDLLGLKIESVPAEFIEKWSVIFKHIGTINGPALGISVLSLAILIFWPRVTQKLPGSLIAVIVATLIVKIFDLPVETIGSRFGSVPNTLPGLQQLDLTWGTIREMFRPAVTIALLGGIESLLSAVVADGMLGTRHRSNTELVAQGVGNICSALFYGIPATGAIARTATNIKNGGRTPIAAIVHAIVLFLIMLCFGELAALIPLASLAAILVFVAYHMSEWRSFARALKYPASDVAVLVTTFMLTVLIDLTVAIEVGVVLSAFLFVKKMEGNAGVQAVSEAFQQSSVAEHNVDSPRDFSRAIIPQGVEVFEAFGPIFFSAVDRFTANLSGFEKQPRVLILYIPRVGIIDGSGLRAIQSVNERAAREKCILVIAGAVGQPLRALKKSEVIPLDRLCSSLEDAYEMAKRLIENETK